MEFEKSCIDSNSKDTTDANSAKEARKTYLNAVVTQFPPEAVNQLASYFGSMQDVKHIMNLHLRGQKYAESGSFIAKRALSSSTERERLSLLQVIQLVWFISSCFELYKC